MLAVDMSRYQAKKPNQHMCLLLAVFVARPTERASMAQGLFMVGPGAGP